MNYRNLILAALKAKFEGVSEAALGRIADKLAKTVTSEEGVKTAVDGVNFSQVLESYGDARATEAQQTAVKNYEQKHGLKDGKKIEQQQQQTTQQQQQTDETPAWAKAMMEQNKALTDRIAKIEGDRTASSRTQQLKAAISGLPEAMQKAFLRTPITGTDDEWSATLASITEDAKGLATTTRQKGAIFNTPQHGSGNNDELSKSQLEAINNRGGNGGNDAQPF